MCSCDIFLGLLAILFPPLPVWVKRGICSADSLINICLCMLGFIPGLLHAWYIIAKFPDEHEYGSLPQHEESGRVSYVIVSHGPGQPQPQRKNMGAASTPSANVGYGTTTPMAPPAQQSQNNAAEGSSGGAVPPTYAEAVKGDNKVQTSD